MAKAQPDDFDKSMPGDKEGDDRAEFERKLSDLEREASTRLEETGGSIDSVRRPMEMPDVLRDRGGDGGRGHGGKIGSGAGGFSGGADQNALAKVWTIGLDFAMMVVAGGALGWLVDRFVVKDGHWGLLVGFLVGLVVGMTRFIREGLAANRRAMSDLKKKRR